jgi:hypothetical protein
MRLLSSANAYTYEVDGVLYETKRYFGWYLGLDFGYEVVYFRRQGILLVSGIGWDGFSTNPNRAEDEDPNWINSFNYNIGVGYRLYFKKDIYRYIEFDVKYNFINYRNEGGTDLSGDAISILFLYGTFFI